MDNILERLRKEGERIEAEANAEHAKNFPEEEETVSWVYKHLAFEGCDNLIYTAGYMEGLAFAAALLKKKDV